ncbi:uncharacterized protein LOC135075371 [Ostrinia nubilalis]|uniref:uncharacterized protein LOC135075371 n=1 Tax=Ostrinia nubilalis TaxID=29057 RepID=UPI00308229F8
MKMWSMWCRALVGAWLVALGASLELYDQLPADEVYYQDENDIDTGPSGNSLPSISDVMMRRLLKAWPMQRFADVTNGVHSIPMEGGPGGLEHPQLAFTEPKAFKASVYKRLSEVYRAPASGLARPQQKWKIKKGKALGSQMVCYFKLCAFRSPQ